MGSLRFVGAVDWREFVESMSLVEQELREDPACVYGAMDFGTRDHYRHSIEAIAKLSPLSQIEVARKAIALASDIAQKSGRDDRAAHVGFYLIGAGRSKLERAVG